jgi:alpha-glucuronidase
MRLLRLALLLCATAAAARSEDGYRLWLRYDRVEEPLRSAYAASLPGIVLATPTGADSTVLASDRDELSTGLRGMLGADVQVTLAKGPAAPSLGLEGYTLAHGADKAVAISANTDSGILYGSFALLRLLQTRRALNPLDQRSVPRIQRRILDHWDNLDGVIERGYAGHSLWNWFELPDYVDPRTRDYARADASVGINGVALTNVNANPLLLTPEYLRKVAALAGVFRAYGIQVYLTARFSSPIELGGLKTADPLDPGVIQWWRDKADEIYRYVPDLGGFVVKANSEGQPGPQEYGRTHADGANLLADALAPHGGIVMWRAFVYDQHDNDDRVKQAFREFRPLDGKFRDNVVIQIKNGPLDFQPREPFHPLFGAMPKTQLALEVQLTQEYLGGSVWLAYLAPLYQEVLDSDTFRPGPGSTVARVVDGSLDRHPLSAIAGVANIGDDRNWTGHPLSSSNWYAFGRLAWDPSTRSAAIADEWIRQTFSSDPRVVGTMSSILMASRGTIVDSTMPLGLAHIMAYDHHYGPGPWVIGARPDWSAPYYHHADAVGLGFERTPAGSNALSQYAPELAAAWGDLATCPEDLLLWFHHVPWDRPMASGRTLWDELCLRYQRGVDETRGLQRQWDSLQGTMDPERFLHVKALLARQEREARGWRDGCLLYFQQFSKRPLPRGVEAPEHSLDFYESLQLHYVPGSPSGK